MRTHLTSTGYAVRRAFAALAIAVVGVVGVAGVGVTPALADSPVAHRAIASPAMALSGTNFNAGYIISDYAFYNSNSMTQPEIQSFLSTMIGSCSNANCLNIKRVTTFDRAADRNICAPYKGAPSELASAIIYK